MSQLETHPVASVGTGEAENHDKSILERLAKVEHKLARLAALFDDGFQLSDLMKAVQIVGGVEAQVKALSKAVFPQDHR